MNKKEKIIIYSSITLWLTWAIGLIIYSHFILHV
jgi:hypothetical protein